MVCVAFPIRIGAIAHRLPEHEYVLADGIAIGDNAVIFLLATLVPVCDILPISVVQFMEPLLGVFVQLFDATLAGWTGVRKGAGARCAAVLAPSLAVGFGAFLLSALQQPPRRPSEDRK